MRILGPEQTMRLWDRLHAEATEYYGTLHGAKNQLRHIGPNRFDDLEQTFSDLQRQHDRLKHRLMVMAIIGGKAISDQVIQLSDNWVLDIGEIQAALKERGYKRC